MNREMNMDNEMIYGTEDIERVIRTHEKMSNTYKYGREREYEVNNKYKKYRNIPVDFLESLFGEEWQDIFEVMYTDVEEFKEEYGFELEEWLEKDE